ncbi:MAG: HD domain-containing protein [Coprococcus sp.]
MARNLVSIVKEKMIEYYAGDSRRVHHFLKVHSFAKLIAEMEGMEPDEMQLLEIAALAHDIGIKNAELKYGYNNGSLQNRSSEARWLLREAGAEDAAVGEGMLSGGTSPHLQEYRRFGLSDTGGGRFPRQHV